MQKAGIFILIIAVLFIKTSQAQSSSSESLTYTNAIGVKFYPAGITFKHFLNDKNAVEALGYFYNRGTRLTGLYEINNDLPGIDGLKWYIGPGAHIGLLSNNYGGGLSLGLDGVLGLDYKVAEAPINISLDFQPSIDLARYYGNNRVSIWGGVGVRYTF